MKFCYVVLGILLFLCLSYNTKAQFDPVKGCVIDPNGKCLPNTLLTAVPFLRIIPDARSGAMGDAGIGLSPDPNAMHFNASKLAFVDRDLSLSATYTPWLRELGLNDIYLAYLSGYKQIDELQAIGFSLRFFSLGDINFTDINGNASGTGMPRELEISTAYARKLSPNFSAGLTAKYIHSNLASGQSVQGIEITSANSFAADISFTYKSEVTVGAKESDLTFGLAISNIGAKVSYTRSTLKDFLPANLGFGAALKMGLDDFNSLTFALDFNKLLVPTPVSPDHPDYDTDQNGTADYREESTFGGIFGSFSDAPGGFSEEMREFTFGLGAEYWYDNQFAVRAGYYYEHPLKGDRQFLTVGLGLRYNVFGLNLSYLVPTNNRRNPLNNTLRFTMNFNLESFQDQQNN